jgi:hypothetical protein
LVHEVYLRLVPQADATWEDRGKFVGIAAHVMRRILVEHARGRRRLKGGGGAERLPVEQNVAAVDADGERCEDLDQEDDDGVLRRVQPELMRFSTRQLTVRAGCVP